jgi:integrase/recombinase XerD
MSQSSKIDQRTLLGDDYILIWVEAFLKERTAQNLAKGTVKFYKDKLSNFIKFLDSQEIKYITQITPNIIRDFLLVLEESGHNAGGVHAHFRVIRTWLRWYWDEVEPEGKNPISKVKAPRVPVEPIEGISNDDFDVMISACKTNTFYGERDITILQVLLETGIRAKELLDLDIRDVNLMDSSIFIKKGKGRKPRMVFIGKKVRKQIRKWLKIRVIDADDTNALFINRNEERMVYPTLRQILRRLALKANIKEPSPHDFRRAFCLECLRKGLSEITIARLMGHTTTQLIGRYAKQTMRDLGNSYKSILDDE